MKTSEEMAKSVFLRRDEYNRQKKKKKKTSLRIISAVLCISLCVGSASYLIVKNNTESGHETNALLPVKSAKPENEVVYPKAIAYDDYDARFERRENNVLSEEFIEAFENFSVESASQVLKSGEKNQNYSPFSLYYALSVCALGANGDTRDELLGLLGVDDTDFLMDECKKLYTLTYLDNGIGKLKSANSVWLNENITFKDVFLNNITDSFFAEAYYCDFHNEETGKKVGKWIKKQTNGTLSPVITFDDPENTALSVINTVYFYDEWASEFNKSKNVNEAFYAADGEKNAEFMCRTNQQDVYVGEDFIRASIYLKSGGRMDFILPNEGVELSSLYASKESLNEALFEGDANYIIVHWKLPKFSFSASYTALSDVISALGANKMFNVAEADFTGITDTTDIPLYVNQVIQESYISIDEKGVEASAYTRLDMNGAAAPPTEELHFYLNRPFLYAIYAPESNVPLFIGTVSDPTLE